MSNAFKQTGITKDGVPVISFFSIVDAHGVPIEIIVPEILSRGMMPDWLDFYLKAMACGWSESNTLLRLETTVQDSFRDNPEFVKEWKLRMDFIVAIIHSPDVSPRLMMDYLKSNYLDYGETPNEADELLVFDRNVGLNPGPGISRFMISEAMKMINSEQK